MGVCNEDLVFASFRKCTIIPFGGTITYMTLNSLNSHLNKCAELVHYDLGDSNLGFIVLIAPPATYTLLSTLQLIEPTNVGQTLAMPDPTPIAVVLSEMV